MVHRRTRSVAGGRAGDNAGAAKEAVKLLRPRRRWRGEVEDRRANKNEKEKELKARKKMM
jgi:hypothetical protein